MLIECPYCESKVDAKILSTHTTVNPELIGPDLKTAFSVCPSCCMVLIAQSENLGYDPYTHLEDWSDWYKVYPEPNRVIHNEIPQIVRVSLEEAEKCFKAKAYTASTVMSGRALEAICSHFKINKTLQKGLLELKENNIIDNKLYEWGEEIRKHRNIGAHASEKLISREDSEDVLDFVLSTCDYIFVLTAKFNKFLARQNQAKTTDENTNLPF